MGTLYWQIDDCWPVASWSSMDYYKRWKALHYAAKKTYEPIIVSPVMKKDTFNVYIVSDKFEPVKAELVVKVIDFDGKEVYNKSTQVKVKANESKSYLKIKKEVLIGNSDEGKIAVVCQLINDKEILADNILFFQQPKDLVLEKPEIKMNVTKNDNGYSVELSTNKLAKDVYLSIDEDGFFTDNYFDLLPGVVKKIELKTSKEISSIENKIKVVSLVDSF